MLRNDDVPAIDPAFVLLVFRAIPIHFSFFHALFRFIIRSTTTPTPTPPLTNLLIQQPSVVKGDRSFLLARPGMISHQCPTIANHSQRPTENL